MLARNGPKRFIKHCTFNSIERFLQASSLYALEQLEFRWRV